MVSALMTPRDVLLIIVFALSCMALGRWTAEATMLERVQNQHRFVAPQATYHCEVEE